MKYYAPKLRAATKSTRKVVYIHPTELTGSILAIILPARLPLTRLGKPIRPLTVAKLVRSLAKPDKILNGRWLSLMRNSFIFKEILTLPFHNYK
jgi:hypothetical protein